LRAQATLLSSEFYGSGFPAFLTPSAPKLNSGSVLAVVFAILDLAGGNVGDQRAEPDRIARALKTTVCHGGNVAWSIPIGNPASRLLQFKLTHYPRAMKRS
jgi:hypothetical protein